MIEKGCHISLLTHSDHSLYAHELFDAHEWQATLTEARAEGKSKSEAEASYLEELKTLEAEARATAKYGIFSDEE